MNNSPKTLGDYRKIAAALGGEGSSATKFFDEKILEQGENELVIAAESQMTYLIMSLIRRDAATP